MQHMEGLELYRWIQSHSTGYQRRSVWDVEMQWWWVPIIMILPIYLFIYGGEVITENILRLKNIREGKKTKKVNEEHIENPRGIPVQERKTNLRLPVDVFPKL